jgi:PKD repeat protein
MNKLMTAALLLVLCLTGLTTVKAESYGDLIVGFTTETGNDHLQDIGSSASITNGQTWNLATLLSGVSLSTVYWGVIGDATTTDSSVLTNISTKADTIFTTAVQTPPQANEDTFGYFDLGINSILNNDFAGGQYGTYPGNTNITTAATADDSWNMETINGTHPTDIVNSFGNPNVAGTNTANPLWQVTANSSAPVELGKFTLNNLGVLTYTLSATVAAPVAAFAGTPTNGFAPLTVVFTNTSTGSITNWLWSFGDGHSVTNITSVNVTNIYAAAGTYAVTETVTGAGGASTNKLTGYITAYATPKLSSATLPGGKFVLSGTNAPAGVQYRILSATNLTEPLTSWKPVLTNTFLSNSSFAYTNGSPTNAAAFFRLVSP